MDILTVIFLIIILVVIIQICSDDMYKWFNWMCGYDYKSSMTKKKEEKFNGALQSLYSNDGIQDIHLTVNSDNVWGDYGWDYDPYRYWRGVAWNLPTRNLDKVIYYPYLYEYNLDRYGRFYPYW